jgi:hypothetical protein
MFVVYDLFDVRLRGLKVRFKEKSDNLIINKN